MVQNGNYSAWGQLINKSKDCVAWYFESLTARDKGIHSKITLVVSPLGLDTSVYTIEQICTLFEVVVITWFLELQTIQSNVPTQSKRR